MDYRQYRRKVHAGEDYRDKEYSEHLRIDALFYVIPGHAHLLHDSKSGLILKTFGYLLVVNDEYARDEEDHAQKYTEEEQSSECLDEILTFTNPALSAYGMELLLI